MNYEEMIDFEINLKVANLVRDEWINVSRKEGSETCLHIIDSNGATGHTKHSYVDYCNNPSDAWPIIVENGISLVWMNAEVSYYEAHGINEEIWDEDWQSQHPNALRAAMICFLKMKDAEK